MSLFGSSGIRRIADRSMLEIAFKTGIALGNRYRDIIIARDTRTSGNAVKYALLSGMLSSGVTCRDAGIVPTPTLAKAVRESQIGVMITASHNPPEYNGIKIFNPDGSSFDSSQQFELEHLINEPKPVSPWNEMQTDCMFFPGAVENHIRHIIRDFTDIKKSRVIVDCGCGAASVITPDMLRCLGCETITLNSHPSGFFPHNIEPTETNLKDLIQICRQMETVGIAHDGDADRMMAIDEKGRFITGDTLLILLAKQMHARKIVTTVDASMAVEDAGFTTVRTKVGDTFVSEELRKGGEFGGEPSGAWIFPQSSLCPDGIYAAAAFVSLASQTKISTLVDNIPQYPVIRGSIPNSGIAFPDIIRALSTLGAVKTDDSDGFKLIFNDSWLLCRASGTEPKIRITTEARNETRARQLYESALETIRNISKTKR